MYTINFDFCETRLWWKLLLELPCLTESAFVLSARELMCFCQILRPDWPWAFVTLAQAPHFCAAVVLVVHHVQYFHASQEVLSERRSTQVQELQ